MQTKAELTRQLQKLRDQFENTRPILPAETRPFTYQRVKKDKKGKPLRGEPNWEWVTIDSTVVLRSLKDPRSEELCREICQKIRVIKKELKPYEKRIYDE